MKEAAQLEGLRALQAAAYERSRRALPIVFGLGDVGVVLFTYRGGARQVCFETGAYDGWSLEGARPVEIERTDMTLGEAVEWLLSEPQKGGRE